MLTLGYAWQVLGGFSAAVEEVPRSLRVASINREKYEVRSYMCNVCNT